MGKCWERNTDKIKQYNTWYSQDIETYRKFAAARSNSKRFNQPHLTVLTENMLRYLKETETPTVTGIYLAAGISKKEFYSMRHQNYDWKLVQFMEYNDIEEEDIEQYYDECLGIVDYWISPDGEHFIMNTYSEVIEKVLLYMESKLEAMLYTTKRNPNAIIFALKNKFGWTETPDNFNQTIAVCKATVEEARASIKEVQAKMSKNEE